MKKVLRGAFVPMPGLRLALYQGNLELAIKKFSEAKRELSQMQGTGDNADKTQP